MRLNVISYQKIIIMHLLFWVGYLSLSVFVFAGREDFDRALLISAIQIIPQMIIAYINMELLIPKFFIKKKYVYYIVLVLLCFAILYLFYEFILPEIFNHLRQPSGRGSDGGRWMRGENPGRPDRRFFNAFRKMRLVYSFTQTLAIFFLSTAFKTSQLALKREKEASDLKSENLNSELKFLKSQINPHFLFNALNNIYALSIVKSEKTPDIILKLSEMLRYIIYDCNADMVPLQKEMNYINNYIDMQKLKDEQITAIDVDFSAADPKSMIAPMIFIPFIENSFKHSKIEDVERGWVKMKIYNDDQKLHFLIQNSVPPKDFTKDKQGGVGLENVTRRLELIYQTNYDLRIEQEKGIYTVHLSIQL